MVIQAIIKLLFSPIYLKMCGRFPPRSQYILLLHFQFDLDSGMSTD